MAKTKAELEYNKYRSYLDTQPLKVDVDFEKAIKQIEEAQKSKSRKMKIK